MLIGPEASDAALAARRRELVTQPERFIAQELVALSTHPTFDGDGIYPHHVDLRAFVHLRATSGCLGLGARDTRGADAGSQSWVADRQLVVRRRQQGHLDSHRPGATGAA